MTSLDTARDTFTALVPELTSLAAASFRYLDSEAREEATQNTLALCWHAFHALIEQGRGDEEGIIRSILWFSVKQTKTRRTLPTGYDTKPKDVFDYSKRGRCNFEHAELEQFVSRDTPVPDAVSFRVDVPAFFATLNDRQQRFAEALMTGATTSEVAAKFDVTPGAISQFRAGTGSTS